MSITSKLMAACLACVVSACEGGGAAPANPQLGTVGGAAAGGALGSLIGSGGGRTAAIVGGALLGGAAGNQLVDRPAEEQRRQQFESSRDREMQRQLAFQRESALQQEQVRRQIEEQRLFDEWRQQRTGGSPSGSSAGDRVDVPRAQRYLMALGYYNGRVDGVAGPQTRAAVQRFQANRGLPQTGVITPDLMGQLRQAI